jgi:hypothetical protein
MKISEQAWHVKANWISFRWEPNKYYPISLCPYFWMTVAACILMPFILLLRPVYVRWARTPPWSEAKKEKVAKYGLIANFAVIGGSWIWFAVVYALAHGLWMLLRWAEVGAVLLGLIGAVIVLVFEMYDLYSTYHVEKERPPKPKQPSIVVAWVKAKKSKVCPIIEWEP